MKKVFLAFSILSLLFVSCKKDDNSNNSSNNNGNVSGSWRVTTFSERGDNDSHDFTGWSFNFNDNSILVATKGSTTQNGTWNNSSSSSKFIIDLGAKSNSNPLGELTDDWKIISITSTKIELTDDNDASQEFLTFTKN